MLHVPQIASHLWTYDNWGANPSVTPGTSVVPGISNAEGSWTQVASAANIGMDVFGINLRVSDGGTSAVAKNHILDIGVDPAGGTSYTSIISNIVCGDSSIASGPGSGHNFFFPFFIKAGSSVAVRIAGSHTTAGSVRVGARFYGYSSRPEAFPVGTYSETIGTITGSLGVTVTPGNAADGAWTLLGTTTNPLWWWQIGYQLNNATITAEYTYIEIAYGDASNKHSIMKEMHIGTTTETIGTSFKSNLNFFECYAPVPAGVNIYARMRCVNAPDTGYNMVAIGVGGGR